MNIIKDNFTIRNATAKDAKQLATWWNDGAVMAHAGFPNGLGTTPEKVAADLASDSDKTTRRHIIELSGKAIGEMNYRNLGDKTAIIGIKICDFTEQNKGYGTILLTVFIDTLFRHMGYETIDIDTNLTNTRAQKVYEQKLGFRKVCVNENSWRNQLGELQSQVCYKLSRADWLMAHPIVEYSFTVIPMKYLISNHKVTLYPCQTESDFRQICAIESEIAKVTNPAKYAPHPCSLVFDRYMFGSSDSEVFTYGKLLKLGEQTIGYALTYLAFPGETEYTLRILPGYKEHLHEAICCVEAAFADKSEYSMIVNKFDVPLQQALEKCGYERKESRRWLGWLELTKYTPQKIEWINETIRPLCEADIDDRVRYGEIPTGHAITRLQYEAMMSSDYYGNAIDYVIYDNATNAFAGFVTWWIDDNSKTAVLEPVACLPEFRRHGIMKRALWYGLNELKDKGIRHVFVSTSIHNEKSQPLYLSVGFQNIGTAYRYVKEANS